MRQHLLLLLLLLGSLGYGSAEADPPAGTGGDNPAAAPPVDRTAYNLFHPTPADRLRDFAQDRPSVTNGPFTIDPGHIMLEEGILEYGRDRSGDTRIDAFAIGDTNVRVGVTSSAEIDLAFVAYSYNRSKDKATNSHLKQSGIGDLTIRAKLNLFGDDGGNLAIALFPAFTLPTGRNGLGNRGFSGGLGLPVQLTLPADFQLTLESIVQSLHHIGGGSSMDYLNSLCLTRNLTKKASFYLEFASDTPTTTHQRWSGTVDTGFVYLAGENWEWDFGVNLGVTRSATDALPFFGASRRF